MEGKHKFPRAFALPYVIVILIKVNFSVFGFLSFGSKTHQVILNKLPPGPFRMSISFLFVLSCILSYALPLFPVFDLLQRSNVVKKFSSEMPVLCPFLIRITVVMSTIIVAILVLNFALVVSFSGSIFTTFFTYIFPSAVHLKLKFRQLV